LIHNEHLFETVLFIHSLFDVGDSKSKESGIMN